jgi:hypothetical protein
MTNFPSLTLTCNLNLIVTGSQNATNPLSQFQQTQPPPPFQQIGCAFHTGAQGQSPLQLKKPTMAWSSSRPLSDKSTITSRSIRLSVYQRVSSCPRETHLSHLSSLCQHHNSTVRSRYNKPVCLLLKRYSSFLQHVMMTSNSKASSI